MTHDILKTDSTKPEKIVNECMHNSPNNKTKVVLHLFYMGVIICFFGSINISWFWNISKFYLILSSFFIFISMLIALGMRGDVYSRRDYLLPIFYGTILYMLIAYIHSQNAVGIIFSIFPLFIFYSLFRLNPSYYHSLSTLLCKLTAILLTISLGWFTLHLLGFSLPSRQVNWNEWYYYTDYYFFLLDNRCLYEVLPRFHSIFLEPGHMGTLMVLLLASQIGYWNKWYNIILIIAMILSFSLAAYVLFVILLFLRTWVHRKKITRKIILTLAAIAIVIAGSFIYKGGDNLFNQLIVMRLELNEEGDDIEGNNRVSNAFQYEYDNFIQSDDIMFGRGRWENEDGGRNAGYKLFLYENGLVTFLLVYLFYFASMRKAKDKRMLMAMFILSLANFWTRAYPLWFAFYIPYFLMAHQDFRTHISTSNLTPTN